MVIAVMRPKLPPAGKIGPYLERIDASRTYSNFGPLNTEFEARLLQRYRAPEGSLTTVSNATIGLALALTAMGCKPGSLCAIPAWTFVASAHAAMMAGMTPWFVDVDGTWALDPEATARAIASVPGDVGAVMPVAPFGQPLDLEAWQQFHERTGVPVVVDAAAGFDAAVTAGAIPVVVSLHATKVLGIGEGSFVLSTDRALIREIRMRSNFGFDPTRKAQVHATNGKLSEYHAAVGLAALDQWNETRAEWMAAAALYRDALNNNALRLQPGFGETWVGSACVLELAGPDARQMEASMAAAGIETRRWWGDGAHRHPATTSLPAMPLPQTERLVEGTLAVPFYRDLSPEIVDRVATALLAVQQCDDAPAAVRRVSGAKLDA